MENMESRRYGICIVLAHLWDSYILMHWSFTLLPSLERSTGQVNTGAICSQSITRLVDWAELCKSPKVWIPHMPLSGYVRRYSFIRFTCTLYRVFQKTAQSLRHHTFAIVHQRVLWFSAKSSESNCLQEKVSVWIQQLNILCFAAGK